jgi:hypothetical protein
LAVGIAVADELREVVIEVEKEGWPTGVTYCVLVEFSPPLWAPAIEVLEGR